MKPHSMTVEQWAFYKGMLTMCAIVLSWCLIAEWAMQAGMIAACK